jgi:hypothetical protein
MATPRCTFGFSSSEVVLDMTLYPWNVRRERRKLSAFRKKAESA